MRSVISPATLSLLWLACTLGAQESATPPLRLLLAGDDREVGAGFATALEEFLQANGIGSYVRVAALPGGTLRALEQEGDLVRDFNRQRADFVVLGQSAAAWRNDPLGSSNALDALDTEFRKLDGVTLVMFPSTPPGDRGQAEIVSAAAARVNAPVLGAGPGPQTSEPDASGQLYRAWSAGLDVARSRQPVAERWRPPSTARVSRETADSLWRAVRSEADATAQSALPAGWEEITAGMLRVIGPELTIEGGLGSGVGHLIAIPRRGTLFATLNGRFGMLRSNDGGSTWQLTNAPVRGRGYGGCSASLDPLTGRFAVFSVVNRSMAGSALTVDGGQSWREITRPAGIKHDGWTWGSVDWSTAEPRVLLGKEHHNYTAIWMSRDAGVTWGPVAFKGRSLGVVDAQTLVASPGIHGDGIQRSTDAGRTWVRVSPRRVNGKVPVRYGRNLYWTGQDGLLVSRDAGSTWELLGEPLNGALWGPYFGDDEGTLLVVARDGFFLRRPGRDDWQHVAPFFAGRPGRGGGKYDVMHPTVSYAWDPGRGLIFCGVVGGGLFRFAFPAIAR